MKRDVLSLVEKHTFGKFQTIVVRASECDSIRDKPFSLVSFSLVTDLVTHTRQVYIVNVKYFCNMNIHNSFNLILLSDGRMRARDSATQKEKPLSSLASKRVNSKPSWDSEST